MQGLRTNSFVVPSATRCAGPSAIVAGAALLHSGSRTSTTVKIIVSFKSLIVYSTVR